MEALGRGPKASKTGHSHQAGQVTSSASKMKEINQNENSCSKKAEKKVPSLGDTLVAEGGGNWA